MGSHRVCSRNRPKLASFSSVASLFSSNFAIALDFSLSFMLSISLPLLNALSCLNSSNRYH